MSSSRQSSTSTRFVPTPALLTLNCLCLAVSSGTPCLNQRRLLAWLRTYYPSAPPKSFLTCTMTTSVQVYVLQAFFTKTGRRYKV